MTKFGWARLLLSALVIMGVAGADSRSVAHASEDVSGSHAEILEYYRSLLKSIDEPAAQSATRVQLGNQTLHFNDDAVGAIVRASLQPHSASSVETVSESEIAGSKKGIKHWARAALRRTIQFGLEIPGVVAQGAQQYGLSFAVYTLVTEGIEHLFIPHPAFCKLLQGAYFATAGIGFNFCRVATSPIPNDGPMLRMKTAYLAAREEFLFRYFRKNALYLEGASDPLTTKKDFKKRLEVLGQELRFAEEFWSGSVFWADLYSQMGHREALEGFTDAKAPNLAAQVHDVFHMDERPARLWRAYRLTAFLESFLELLSAARQDLLMEDFEARKLGPVQYWRYLEVMATLGSLGKALEIQKSQLFAAASAENLEHSEAKANMVTQAIETEILPLLHEAVILGQRDWDRQSMKALRVQIKDVLKNQARFKSRCDELLN